jgi:hypothetical protein
MPARPLNLVRATDEYATVASAYAKDAPLKKKMWWTLALWCKPVFIIAVWLSIPLSTAVFFGQESMRIRLELFLVYRGTYALMTLYLVISLMLVGMPVPSASRRMQLRVTVIFVGLVCDVAILYAFPDPIWRRWIMTLFSPAINYILCIIVLYCVLREVVVKEIAELQPEMRPPQLETSLGRPFPPPPKTLPPERKSSQERKSSAKRASAFVEFGTESREIEHTKSEKEVNIGSIAVGAEAFGDQDAIREGSNARSILGTNDFLNAQSQVSKGKAWQDTRSAMSTRELRRERSVSILRWHTNAAGEFEESVVFFDTITSFNHQFLLRVQLAFFIGLMYVFCISYTYATEAYATDDLTRGSFVLVFSLCLWPLSWLQTKVILAILFFFKNFSATQKWLLIVHTF